MGKLRLRAKAQKPGGAGTGPRGLREPLGKVGWPVPGHLLSRESWEVSAFMGVGSLQDRLKLRSRRSANAAVRAKPPLASGGGDRGYSGPRLGGPGGHGERWKVTHG